MSISQAESFSSPKIESAVHADGFAQKLEKQQAIEIDASQIGDFLQKSNSQFLSKVAKDSPSAAELLHSKGDNAVIEAVFDALKDVFSNLSFANSPTTTATKQKEIVLPTISHFDATGAVPEFQPQFNANAATARAKLENIFRADSVNFRPEFLQMTLENCFADSKPKFRFFEKTPPPFAEFVAILVQTGDTSLAQTAIVQLKKMSPASFNFTHFLESLNFQDSLTAQKMVAGNLEQFLFFSHFFGVFRDEKARETLTQKVQNFPQDQFFSAEIASNTFAVKVETDSGFSEIEIPISPDGKIMLPSGERLAASDPNFWAKIADCAAKQEPVVRLDFSSPEVQATAFQETAKAALRGDKESLADFFKEAGLPLDAGKIVQFVQMFLQNEKAKIAAEQLLQKKIQSMLQLHFFLAICKTQQLVPRCKILTLP